MSIYETLSAIIVNIFSSHLYDADMNFIEKYRFRKFRKKLNSTIKKHVLANDGSILTTGTFEDFLKYHHPIEKLIESISGEKVSGSREQLTETLTEMCLDCCSGEVKSPSDRVVLIEFFEKIYDITENYFRESLSKNEKFLAGIVEKNTSVQLTESGRDTDKIIREIEKECDLLQEFKSDLHSDIQTMLANVKKLEDPGSVWSVYCAFSDALMDGRAEEYSVMYSLIDGKNRDLELGVAYLFQLFSDIEVRKVTFSDVQEKIIEERIYGDLAQKTIYFSLLRKDTELLNLINERNLTLYEIRNYLLAEKYDVFYSVETVRDDGKSVIRYKLLDNYPDYTWIVKRICMFSVLDLPVLEAAVFIESLLGKDTCVTDQVLILEKHIQALLSIKNPDENQFPVFADRFEALKGRMGHMPSDVRIRFYCSYIRLGYISSVDEAHKIIERIPPELKRNDEIAILCLHLEIKRGTASEQDVIDICIKNDQYWLFNNYLGPIVENEPEKVKSLIEKYLFIIDKEPAVFLIYVQLVHKLEGEEKASALFLKYQDKYGDCLEFWIDKLRLVYSDEELTEITEKWFKRQLRPLSTAGEYEFLRLLMYHRRYKEVLRGLLFIENGMGLPEEFLRIKAKALMNTGHEIEALEVYKNLFREQSPDDEIVYYIMALSVKNRRNVSQAVYQCGKQSEKASLLSLASSCAQQNGNHEEAALLLRKAMFRCSGEQDAVFGQYLHLYLRNIKEGENSIKYAGADTAIHCMDETGNTRVICIHAKEILPSDPYTWENAEHIYMDSAIKRGFVRKKIGDYIEWDEIPYKITKIDAMDTFLFHISVEHMIGQGNARSFSTRTDESGHVDADILKKQLKEALGSTSPNLTWLEQYKNFREMPLSFWYYKDYTNITYTQLITAFVQDPQIVYRETYGNVKKADQPELFMSK